MVHVSQVKLFGRMPDEPPWSLDRPFVAQRVWSDHRVELTNEMYEAVCALDLGNGRTYQLMCKILPDREVFVFDRAIASQPDSTPHVIESLLAKRGLEVSSDKVYFDGSIEMDLPHGAVKRRCFICRK